MSAAAPLAPVFAARPARLGRAEEAALAAVARREAGIELHGGKTAFLQARLARRLAARGLDDYAAYVRLLGADPQERARFVEALTTHTTSFFREGEQYRWLEAEGLPALYEAGAGRERDLTIWSAACSTGQEGWSALMVAERLRRARLHGLRARLVGTDISTAVLARAAAAVYPAEEVAAVPLDLRRLCLLSARNGDGRCRVAPELRARAVWRRANLLDPATHEGIAADVAFLRNVLIYFDAAAQARVVDAILRRLRPGGYLLTGHTEALPRRPGLVSLRPSIYRKEP